MTAVAVYVMLSVLLVAGKVLRVQIPVLQRLYLPSSVVGGLIGLVVIACLGHYVPAGVTIEMGAIPGFLINVIFATLLLVPPSSRAKTPQGEVFTQLTLAQIVVWGQYVVGVGLAGFLFAPVFGLHPAFGNLLELGFEGGHGTVGGMSAAVAAHG